MLAGLHLPDSGEVRFDGERMTEMDERDRAALRAQRIGVVVQSDNLIPFLSAAENVELAIQLAGGHREGERARDLLAELGLAHRADDLPAASPAVRPSAHRSPSPSPTIPTSCLRTRSRPSSTPRAPPAYSS